MVDKSTYVQNLKPGCEWLVIFNFVFVQVWLSNSLPAKRFKIQILIFLFFPLLSAVKHDCIFGDDLDLAEISFVSEVRHNFWYKYGIKFCSVWSSLVQVLEKLHRPILYSLSPGTSVTPTMAKDISSLVNMYRVTADDWDTWGDVAAHFDVTR